MDESGVSRVQAGLALASCVVEPWLTESIHMEWPGKPVSVLVWSHGAAGEARVRLGVATWSGRGSPYPSWHGL